MKIIISHDIDHITVSEHFKDLFLPKYFARNTLELINRAITISEYVHRIIIIFSNKFNNIEELVNFDKSLFLDSTFFLAVNNALSLSYSIIKAEEWAVFLKDKGIRTGIHGINYDTLIGITLEKQIFHELTRQNNFGIRMHYLRLNEETLLNLDKSGYKFDSTVLSFGNPYKIEQMWEFPVCLMDSSLFYGNSNYQTKTLDQIKNESIMNILKAEEAGLKYYTIVTHDFYFSDAFKKWKEWYFWLIDYLKNNEFKFISFDNAITELESENVCLDYSIIKS